MGAAGSAPTQRPAVAQHRRAAAAAAPRRTEPQPEALDEKFALAMSLTSSGSAKVADGAHVNASKTLEWVEELLQDPKVT